MFSKAVSFLLPGTILSDSLAFRIELVLCLPPTWSNLVCQLHLIWHQWLGEDFSLEWWEEGGGFPLGGSTTTTTMCSTEEDSFRYIWGQRNWDGVLSRLGIPHKKINKIWTILSNNYNPTVLVLGCLIYWCWTGPWKKYKSYPEIK